MDQSQMEDYLVVFVPLDVEWGARVDDCQLTEEGQVGPDLHGVIARLILVENRSSSHNSRGGLHLDGVADAPEQVPHHAGVVPVIVVPVVVYYQGFSTPRYQDLRASSFRLIAASQLFPIFIPESFGFWTTFSERTFQLDPVAVVACL